MHFTTPDGQTLYYERKGKPQAKYCLVLLGGLTQSTQSWMLVEPGLQEAFELLEIDLVFQGQSSGEGQWRSFDQHAADVAALVRHLGLQAPVPVGISYGGMVVQHMLVNEPDCCPAAVLMATFAHKSAWYDAVELSWWGALEAGGFPLMLDVMLPYVLSPHYFENPLMPIEEMKALRKEAFSDPEPLKKLMKATAERPDYRQPLQAVQSPVLVLAGEADLLFPPEVVRPMADALPQAQMEIIPGAGHTLNLEAVQACNQQIKAFLLA